MSDSDDPIERRRRNRERRFRVRLLLLAGATVLAGVAAAVAVGVAARGRQADGDGAVGVAPAPAGDPDRWTYKDAAEHLKRNGFEGWQYYTFREDAFIYPPGGPRSAGSSFSAMVETSLDHGAPWPDVILIRRHPTAEDARQHAGHTTRPVVAYRNWTFLASPELLPRVRAACR